MADGPEKNVEMKAEPDFQPPARGPSPVADDSDDDQLDLLKQAKSRTKAAFTRARHQLLVLLDDEHFPSRRKVRSAQERLIETQEKTLAAMMHLQDHYQRMNDKKNRRKINEDIDKLENEFAIAQDQAQEYLDARKNDPSSVSDIDLSESVRKSQMNQRAASAEVEKLRHELTVNRNELATVSKKLEQQFMQCQQEFQHKIQEGQERLEQAEALERESQRNLEQEINAELELPRENYEYSDELDMGHAYSRNENQQPARTINPAIYTSEQIFPQQKRSAPDISTDLWKQLQRVSIPVFTGDKRKYEGWKAAFYACIDGAPTTPEYKLLHLRQYLSGEALKAVENLGHSAAAYEAAKERLDRKFGGRRRQVAIHLEELENLPQIRAGNAKDIEAFADLLDVAVVNLKDAGRTDELGNGSLYFKLQKKLTEFMLAQYHRWVYENQRTESVELLREWINREAEFQIIAAETIKGLSCKPQSTRTYYGEADDQYKKSQSASNRRACKLCEESHGIWRCEKFKRMDVSQRWNFAKENRLCFRCLGENHRGDSCTRTEICGLNGCDKNHSRLLHEDRAAQVKTTNQPETSRKLTKTLNSDDHTHMASNHDATDQESAREGDPTPSKPASSTITMMTEDEHNIHYTGHIALRTVPVYLTHNGRKLKVNALLDDASTKTYLNSDVAAELGLHGYSRRATVNVLNGQVETFETQEVEVKLISLDDRTHETLSGFTTNQVTGKLSVIDWNRHSDQWNHLNDIPFPTVATRSKVDLLIGADYAHLHCSIKEVRGQPGEPIARLTPLGWTCVGRISAGEEYSHLTLFANDESDLDTLVRQFWELEDFGVSAIQNNTSPQMSTAIEKAQRSLKFQDDHYVIGIPWRESVDPLPDDYEMATKRLQNTEKRLLRSPEVADTYTEVLQEYTKKGYIRKVDPEEKDPPGVWYLPHFPVVRPEKETTKVRIVFDASAKYDGVSLNDLIHQGPKLQKDIFEVLLRFRRNPTAVVCDIAEMYLRIGLSDEDRPYHRFLWRSMDQNKIPEQYEFNRLVFGVNCSPFLAQYVVQKHAEKHQDVYPLAAETVLKSTYMDDSLDSVQDEDTAIALYQQLSKLWQHAGMHARKWLSNSTKVMQQVPVGDRISKVDLGDGYELPAMKTLGIHWSASNDEFTFAITAPDVEILTKREFLKKIATLFDPLGFLTPFTVRAKILLQEMWMAGLDWDDPLPEVISGRAWSWFGELSDLLNVSVPRCLKLEKDVQSAKLHTFVDASKDAYGAVVYIQYMYNDGSTSQRFVASKSRVAPLKSVSIPRLELMGAVLGLRLTKAATAVLQISLLEVVFWSDSMNVLWWIRRCSRDLKPFIANRVGEIQSETSPVQWRYVPTELNPADLVTRGMTAANLGKSTVWWSGPAYLSKPESEWPQSTLSQIPDDVEVRKAVSNRPESRTYLTSNVDDINNLDTEDQQWRLEPRRYSSWTHFVNVQAWVLRFLGNCKTTAKQRISGPLSPEEIDDSETIIIRNAQKAAFPKEWQALTRQKNLPPKSSLLGLNPKMDEDGVLRCDGRLKYASFLSPDVRFPIILPRKCWVTKLIVKDHHEKGKHICGTNQILAALSSRFWVLSGREAIREWEKQCAECRRRKASTAKQIMAPLPTSRIRSLRAFSSSAVDYGGPFITIQGRGKRREKRYLCLFTCMATRAVHLELAYGLDTDAFLNAFYRMVGRRGLPEEVVSDNGGNFVGANKELKELVKLLDQHRIQQSTANKGVKWRFNPPLAPHFGGVHESMIKSAKRAIYAILGSADVTDEELMTAFIGAESLINSRPLTYQSADSRDDTPLTPNHFLIGQAGGSFAPESVDQTDYHPKRRWRRVQELVRHFWHRWLREWIPGLNFRKKWTTDSKDVRVGEIVLIISTDAPRGHWTLGRILEVHPGRDGRVRVVKVQAGDNQLLRPITKICPLEFGEPTESDS